MSYPNYLKQQLERKISFKQPDNINSAQILPLKRIVTTKSTYTQNELRVVKERKQARKNRQVIRLPKMSKAGSRLPEASVVDNLKVKIKNITDGSYSALSKTELRNGRNKEVPTTSIRKHAGTTNRRSLKQIRGGFSQDIKEYYLTIGKQEIDTSLPRDIKTHMESPKDKISQVGILNLIICEVELNNFIRCV